MKHRVLALAGLLVLAIAPSVYAQSDPPKANGSTPTFTASTELVLVPAIVTDHHGAHIPGLTRDDFVLLENGKEQKISSFEEITPTATPVPELNASTGPLEFTNTRPANFQPRRINIIVLDALNTSFGDQAYARRELIKYLSTSLQPNQLTTLLLLTGTGVKVIHDFTTDTGVLIAAIQRQKGQTGHMEGEDISVIGSDSRPAGNLNRQQILIEADRIDTMIRRAQSMAVGHDLNFAILETVDCMEAIAQAYSGIPGRKSLIWITGGFPMMLNLYDPVVTVYQERRARMFDHLNSANIAVYPVDARGLVNPDFISAADHVPVLGGGFGWVETMDFNVFAHMETLNTFRDVADMTGGRAFFNTNDLSHAVDKAATDSSSYYLLGFYVKAGARKPGWRKLKVKVNRPGLRVRARQGYFVPGEARPSKEDRHRDVLMALYSPFESTALPVTVRWTRQSRADAANSMVSFEVLLDSHSIVIDEANGNRFSVDLVAVATTPDLNVVGNLSQEFNHTLAPSVLAKIRSKGLTFSGQFKMPPGEYTAKFVVRDNLSGRIGSVTAPLNVQ